MTDQEWHTFLLGKLDEWLHWDGDRRDRPDLCDHMNMNSESFIEWRETGIVPKVTRILWVVLDDNVFERIWGESV